MRKDISFPHQAVQACHSIIESFRQTIIPTTGDHPHLVLCTVKSEDKLVKVISKLEDLGIKYSYFIEPDLDNTLTSVATEPISQELRHHFRNYQLLSLPSLSEVLING